jgi:hypothetical protein
MCAQLIDPSRCDIHCTPEQCTFTCPKIATNNKELIPVTYDGSILSRSGFVDTNKHDTTHNSAHSDKHSDRHNTRDSEKHQVDDSAALVIVIVVIAIIVAIIIAVFFVFNKRNRPDQKQCTTKSLITETTSTGTIVYVEKRDRGLGWLIFWILLILILFTPTIFVNCKH